MHDRPHPSDLCTAAGFGPSHAAIGRGGTSFPCPGPVAWDHDRRLAGERDLAVQAALALPGFPIRIGVTAAID
jgi:hypothetical protein